MILQEKRQNTNGWITRNVNWCSGYWARCSMGLSQGTSWTEESWIFKTSDFHLLKICRSNIFTALGVTWPCCQIRFQVQRTEFKSQGIEPRTAQCTYISRHQSRLPSDGVAPWPRWELPRPSQPPEYPHLTNTMADVIMSNRTNAISSKQEWQMASKITVIRCGGTQ